MDNVEYSTGFPCIAPKLAAIVFLVTCAGCTYLVRRLAHIRDPSKQCILHLLSSFFSIPLRSSRTSSLAMPGPSNRTKSAKSRARKAKASGSNSPAVLADSRHDGYTDDVDDADGWTPIVNTLCSAFNLPGKGAIGGKEVIALKATILDWL